MSEPDRAGVLLRGVPYAICARAARTRRDADAQRAYQHEVFLAFHTADAAGVVRETRPALSDRFPTTSGSRGSATAVATLDNIDIEALPTGGAGAISISRRLVRYYRGNFGVTTYGQTGRFKSAWADFGGLKLPAQLDVELASIGAKARGAAIGDQMPPSGRLDPAAVYEVIGRAYGRIKRLEPFLEGAAPVLEAALMTPAGRWID